MANNVNSDQTVSLNNLINFSHFFNKKISVYLVIK